MAKNKRTAWWITLSIIVGIVIVLSVVINYANNMLTNLVNSKLMEQVSTMKNVSISYEDIKINLWNGSATVKNLRYCSNPDNVLYDSVPGFIVESKLTKFQFVQYKLASERREVKIGNVVVNDISAYAYYQKRDSSYKSPSKVELSKAILSFVAAINVNKISIRNASLRFKDLQSSLSAEFDSLYLDVRNLGYDFETDSISYNDSIYYCRVKNIKFVQPDGKYTLTVDELFSENTNNFTIKGIKHVCNVPKEKLAIVNGKVPAVWSSLDIKKVKTSKFNLVRSIVNENFKLDSVNVSGGTVVLYQDLTYPYKDVQRPLQKMIGKIAKPVQVKCVNVNVDRFYFTFTSGIFPPSTLHMNNMKVSVRNFCNVGNDDVTIAAKSLLDGGGGSMSMQFIFENNKKCTWKEMLVLENGNFNAFNGFLGKLAGVEVKGKVKKMQCIAKGDTLDATGRFVMQYKDLEVKVIKGKSPIKELNDNSKFVNGLVKVIVPPANPAIPGTTPKQYRVDGERDLYKPYIIYVLSPMFDGIKETLLAPFFLVKEIKETNPAVIEANKRAIKKYKEEQYAKKKENELPN